MWEIIEQASDDLAADHFQHIAGDFSSAGIPGIRLKGERAYLHLVKNRKRFQWCPAQIKDDEASPFPPGTMHEAVPEVGDAVTFAIIGSLAKIRQSLPKDANSQLNHTLAETVAVVAAAKVHLAVFVLSIGVRSPRRRGQNSDQTSATKPCSRLSRGHAVEVE